MANAAPSKKPRAKRSSVNFRDAEVLADYATRALRKIQEAANAQGLVTPRNCQGDFVRRNFPDLSQSQGYALLRVLRALGLTWKTARLVVEGRQSKNYLHYVNLEVREVTAEMIAALKNGGDAADERADEGVVDEAPAEEKDNFLDDRDFTLTDLIELRRDCDGRLAQLEREVRAVMNLSAALDGVIALPSRS